MIAGLEDITDGELLIDGNVVNDLSPKDRDIAMVFQNYALYPHMSVRDNMGFSLKLTGSTRRRSTTGSRRPHASSTSSRIWTASRRSCRAASVSAWRWGARSYATPPRS